MSEDQLFSYTCSNGKKHKARSIYDIPECDRLNAKTKRNKKKNRAKKKAAKKNRKR